MQRELIDARFAELGLSYSLGARTGDDRRLTALLQQPAADRIAGVAIGRASTAAR